MKILVLCYEYPPVGGGGGRIAATVAEGLATLGHEVKYLTGNVSARHNLPAKELRNGVEVLRVGSPRRSPDTCRVHEMAFYVAWALLPALALVRNFRPDVIHAHFAVPTGALAWAVSKITGVPYVLTAHLGDVPGGVPEQTDRLFRWIKPLTHPIWNGAASVTAVSSFVFRLARDAYGRDVSIVPNGIAATPTVHESAETPPRLLFVGRVSIQKNLRLALDALAKIQDLDWSASIVGDGPLRQEAQAFVKSAGLGERVTFHGWMAPGELAALRKKCKVLLLPSLSEGLPVAAVEALADGLAIIGTDIPGLADVVEHLGNGFLCAPDASTYAAAIRQTLEDKELLESFRIRSAKKAMAFSLDRVVAKYEAVLQEATNNHPPPPFHTTH